MWATGWSLAGCATIMRPSPGSGPGTKGALGGLFSQVLQLPAAEGMVVLGVLSLDGTKLADSASQRANKRLHRSRRCWPRRLRWTPPKMPGGARARRRKGIRLVAFVSRPPW